MAVFELKGCRGEGRTKASAARRFFAARAESAGDTDRAKVLRAEADAMDAESERKADGGCAYAVSLFAAVEDAPRKFRGGVVLQMRKPGMWWTDAVTGKGNPAAKVAGWYRILSARPNLADCDWRVVSARTGDVLCNLAKRSRRNG